MDFRYRFDSYQRFGQPGYVAKVFRRNHEFALVTPALEQSKLDLAYYFTADVDGWIALHQWTPLAAQLDVSPQTHLTIGSAFPYDSTITQPSIGWVQHGLISDSGLNIDLRVGMRQNRSWIAQPVVVWQPLNYLQASINNGRMVEFLLDQAPKAELKLKSPNFPLSTSLMWINDETCWLVSVQEQWQI